MEHDALGRLPLLLRAVQDEASAQVKHHVCRRELRPSGSGALLRRHCRLGVPGLLSHRLHCFLSTDVRHRRGPQDSRMGCTGGARETETARARQVTLRRGGCPGTQVCRLIHLYVYVVGSSLAVRSPVRRSTACESVLCRCCAGSVAAVTASERGVVTHRPSWRSETRRFVGGPRAPLCVQVGWASAGFPLTHHATGAYVRQVASCRCVPRAGPRHGRAGRRR